mgnify:FL=1
MNISLRDMTFIPAMKQRQIEAVENLENALRYVPQVEVETSHMFHAGMYCRTVHMKKFVTFTGALIKIPTVIIISGDVSMYMGTGLVRMTGYHVLEGGKGRKQAFFCHEDTSITMMFASSATTVEEAEAEFTDEGNKLVSRRSANEVIRTEV